MCNTNACSVSKHGGWFSFLRVLSELKRRMKADKKAAEKEAKVKEHQEPKETNDQSQQNAYGADEETLDPNVCWLLIIEVTFLAHKFRMNCNSFFLPFCFQCSNTSRFVHKPFKPWREQLKTHTLTNSTWTCHFQSSSTDITTFSQETTWQMSSSVYRVNVFCLYFN